MGVPVYKRILDLFEAEGVNTLFGIPDPNFVHMFAEADARGWSVVAPHHELSAGFMRIGSGFDVHGFGEGDHVDYHSFGLNRESRADNTGMVGASA